MVHSYILTGASVPTCKPSARLLVILEIVGETEPDEVFGSSFVNVIESVSSRSGVQESPINSPFGPIAEVPISIKNLPNTAILLGGFVKEATNANLVVVVAVADERLACDAFKRLFQRFKFGVVEGNPFFVFMIYRSIG